MKELKFLAHSRLLSPFLQLIVLSPVEQFISGAIQELGQRETGGFESKSQLGAGALVTCI